MKYRSGFVSNSSSSSFIVLLPENIKINMNKVEFADEVTEDEIKDAIATLRTGEAVWEEENYGLFSALSDVLRDYVIGSFDTGPDAGQIAMADAENIRKLLK